MAGFDFARGPGVETAIQLLIIFASIGLGTTVVGAAAGIIWLLKHLAFVP